MSSLNLTGNGAQTNRLYFNGEDEKFELWEVKFLGYLRIKNLIDVVESTEAPNAAKNTKVFAELSLVLDDKSLSLIIRDARNDGRAALKILKDHYIGTSKPRIIGLYIVSSHL